MQFERKKYTYCRKQKKKGQLVDKELTPPQFFANLKDKFQNFPRHRYNVTHTSKTNDQATDALSDGTIIKIQENFQRVMLTSCPMKLCPYTGLQSKLLFPQWLFLEK